MIPKAKFPRPAFQSKVFSTRIPKQRFHNQDSKAKLPQPRFQSHVSTSRIPKQSFHNQDSKARCPQPRSQSKDSQNQVSTTRDPKPSFHHQDAKAKFPQAEFLTIPVWGRALGSYICMYMYIDIYGCDFFNFWRGRAIRPLHSVALAPSKRTAQAPFLFRFLY